MTAKVGSRTLVERTAGSPLPWLVPLAAILLLTFVFPIVEIARLSLTDAGSIEGGYSYTLGSYTQLFTSPYFFSMLTATVIFVAFSVTFQMIFGFFIALAVDQGARRGMRTSIVTRTAVLTAWAVPGVIIGVIWSILYQQSAGGILNYLVSLFGFDSHPVPLGPAGRPRLRHPGQRLARDGF